MTKARISLLKLYERRRAMQLEAEQQQRDMDWLVEEIQKEMGQYKYEENEFGIVSP